MYRVPYIQDESASAIMLPWRRQNHEIMGPKQDSGRYEYYDDDFIFPVRMFATGESLLALL